MSQHQLTTTQGTVLLAGFDRRLGEFFFSLFASQNAEKPVYSTEPLVDPINVNDLDSVADKIRSLVPDVPGQIFDSIRSDALNNVGNRVVVWNQDGTIQSDNKQLRPLKAA